MKLTMSGGRYDAIATAALDAADAKAVVVVVIEGINGTGCSIIGKDRATLARVGAVLQDVLPKMVDEVRRVNAAHVALVAGGRL